MNHKHSVKPKVIFFFNFSEYYDITYFVCILYFPPNATANVFKVIAEYIGILFFFFFFFPLSPLFFFPSNKHPKVGS